MAADRPSPAGSRRSLRWSVGLPLISALIGSLVTAAIIQGRVRILAGTVSYTDLAAVVLTAVTIILAVVALVVAAMAIIGWRAFMKMAEATAKQTAVPAATGAIEAYVATSAEQVLVERAEAVALRVITPERLEQLIREQVDVVLLGNPADQELDADEDAEAETEALRQELEEGGDSDH